LRPAVLAAATLALAAPLAAGTIIGSVALTEKNGRLARDASDVVVYVEGAQARPRAAKATMTMRGKAFTPHVVAVPVGTTVEFPNEDPILHNVFSVSGENRFDLQLYKRPKSGSWTFHKPGVVRVYCNIHPQMSAIVLVTDTPFYAKTRADGWFRIEGVPAGRYTLRAWHERGGEASLPVEVPATGEVGARFALDASSYKRVPHKNKFGKDYASDDEKY
jgi:plastocyanin